MHHDAPNLWYHGSPFQLTELQIGSTITPDRDLARVFSHKPTIVSQDLTEQGERVIKHNGQQAGFLYRIAETVHSSDIRPHPQTTMEPGQEWLINRALPVVLVEPTIIRDGELLSQEELDELRARHHHEEHKAG